MFGNKPPQMNSEFKSKKYYKDNKLSGLYQDFDPYTGKLKEEGRFQNGVETGEWKVIDADGDEIHYSYSMERVGALCHDGTTSTAIGRGACSWHGGVAEWLYEAVKVQTGGTGKYMPIQKRVENLRQEVKKKFGINKSGLQFEEAILNMLLDLTDENEEMLTQVANLEEELQGEKASKEDLQLELKDIKKEKLELEEKLKQKDKEKEKEKEAPKEKAKQVEEKPEDQKTLDVTVEKKKETVGKEKDEQEDKTQKIGAKVEVKAKPQIVEKPKASKEEKKGKKEESDSQQWESVEDERERGQKELINQLFEKMNLK